MSELPLLRVIRVREETIVVICDAELLGKKFRKGKIKLEIKESFYRGREASMEECIEAIKEATIANLIGSIVDRAIEEKLVDPKCVLKFGKVKHAQIVKV
ncbi:MAG: DUF424 family protein [Candidatus Hadarchaeales archaeon]